MNKINRCIRFVERPSSRPTPDVFRIDQEPVSDIKNGEFLLQNNFISMDPALVGRMRAEDNYTDQVNPGEIMHAYGIGQVVASRHPAVRVGEIRFGRVDMQEYKLASNAEDFKVINTGLAEPSWYLSAVGITGATAYFALLDIGCPQAGETVLISSGASSVGSVAAQIARNKGCRIVGIVSTEQKANAIKAECGYHEVVTYRGKNVEQLSADLAKACPSGVDVYFDNTSGDISEAVMPLYNNHARIAVVGRVAISHLADTRDDIGRRDNNLLLTRRIKKQGFVILDYQDRLKGAFIVLAKWVKEGKITLKEDVAQGIAQAPDAFFRMLDGQSQGKQLVQLAEIQRDIDPTPAALGRLLISRRFPTERLGRFITGGI